jgi:uncharacterized protein YkwD
MKQILSLTILALLAAAPLFAQCPPAKASGYHVVQKGETLFSISRKYNVPVQNLLAWNNMSMNDVLHLCRELRVSATPGSPTNTGTPAGTAPAGTTPKQAGALHIVRPGEKVADIAAAYGWAEWRFRKMNNLTAWQEVSPGAGLKTDDCYCPPLDQSGVPSFYEAEQAVIAAAVATPADDRVVQNENAAVPGATPAAQPGLIAPFMSAAEIAMAEEINLLRSNPAAYIPFIEQQREAIKAGKAFGSVETCNELINELKNTLALNKLEPLECLFNAAKKHGEEQRPIGGLSHIGKDGSWPWDRVRRECPSLTDGNENLVGGMEGAREAVITLLLDEGISTRGHRRVLLSPDWRYVGIYYLGQVGTMPHNWIQLFGR